MNLSNSFFISSEASFFRVLGRQICIFLVGVLVLAGTVIGSASAAQAVDSAAIESAAADSDAVDSAVVLEETSSGYKINVGDKIELDVFDDERLSKIYIVSSNGSISLPLLGAVSAKGKTVEALIGDVEEGLKVALINSPKVSAQIVGFTPLYVLGEVEQPGAYEYNFDMTIYSAIAVAGGYTFRAKKSHVMIRRAGSNKEEKLRVGPSLKVYPGDTIRIGQRLF